LSEPDAIPARSWVATTRCRFPSPPRLLAAAIYLARGKGESAGFVTQVTAAFVAASAFTYGPYRRHFVSAVALFALWADVHAFCGDQVLTPQTQSLRAPFALLRPGTEL
jgi:hypothetical protein